MALTSKCEFAISKTMKKKEKYYCLVMFHSSTDSQVCYIDIKLNSICECQSHGAIGDCTEFSGSLGNWRSENKEIESHAMPCQAMPSQI